MLESAWLFVGGVAVVATAGALLTPDDVLAIITGVAGTVAWLIFAYGSLDVRVIGDSVTYSFTMPSVTLFAVMMAIPPAYVMLTGPFEAVARVRSPSPDEV